MKSIGGDFLNSFFTAAYVPGAFACAMASQASVSRILFAMSRDGSLPRPLFARLHPTYRTPVAANLVVGLFGLTALFISLATVSSMISFGALAAFSFVNLAVVKTYVIDRGQRTGADLFKYALLPLLGVAFTLYLWTQLSGADVRDRARLARGRLRRAARHHPRVPRQPPADVHGRRGGAEQRAEARADAVDERALRAAPARDGRRPPRATTRGSRRPSPARDRRR